MPRTTITDFITQMQGCPVIDVRSPGEFAHARMPGAYNLPLFSDEERKVIGTAYKQESREKAIKLGLDYFGPKMRAMVEEVERLTAAFATAGNKEYNGRRVLVHCWRGGMRSGAVSWLLQLYGFEVATLEGGYKAFRNWALEQFSVPYPFAILGGYTGSGKTEILGEMSGKHKCVVIDLEQIAQHKGSAFGGFDAVQPSQEMFENMLALQLAAASATVGDGQYIWLEDESRRIGDINLPPALWLQMNAAPLFFLDIPLMERVNFITRIYGRHKKEQLVNAIIRIQRKPMAVLTELLLMM